MIIIGKIVKTITTGKTAGNRIIYTTHKIGKRITIHTILDSTTTGLSLQCSQPLQYSQHR